MLFISSGQGDKRTWRSTCAQCGFSMKAAREREMSEIWPQNGHWWSMEDDMVIMAVLE